MSASQAEHSSPSEEREVLRQQCELARACAILSAAISLAVLLSNFPGDQKPALEARASVEVHKKLLGVEQQTLQANQQALRDNRNALETVRQQKTNK